MHHVTGSLWKVNKITGHLYNGQNTTNRNNTKYITYNPKIIRNIIHWIFTKYRMLYFNSLTCPTPPKTSLNTSYFVHFATSFKQYLLFYLLNILSTKTYILWTPWLATSNTSRSCLTFHKILPNRTVTLWTPLLHSKQQYHCFWFTHQIILLNYRFAHEMSYHWLYTQHILIVTKAFDIWYIINPHWLENCS